MADQRSGEPLFAQGAVVRVKSTGQGARVQAVVSGSEKDSRFLYALSSLVDGILLPEWRAERELEAAPELVQTGERIEVKAGAPIYRIILGAVEYRGALDPWLDANADALEDLLDDEDLVEIRALAPGERYVPELDTHVMACSFACLRGEGGCICPFGVLRGDCPAHGELVPA